MRLPKRGELRHAFNVAAGVTGIAVAAVAAVTAGIAAATTLGPAGLAIVPLAGGIALKGAKVLDDKLLRRKNKHGTQKDTNGITPG